MNGDTVSYVVNRNINYTNICYFGCGFCAFSKGRVAENLRERGYNLPLAEVQARVTEAWQRGATEVCLQGGIHPDYTGATYLVYRPGGEGGPAGHARARVLAAGDQARGGDPGPAAQRTTSGN